MVIRAAVEGITDEAVVRRLVHHVGAQPGPVYGKRGKGHLRKRIKGYNNSARFWPWIVIVDLNHDADCPPPLRAEWLPTPATKMCFRVAVREVEAWLLADRERIARFLGVSVSRVTQTPELEVDPKRTMINLAGKSRRRAIREDMVPRPGSGRAVGPAYGSRLIEFISTHWRPELAAQSSDSLRRCLIHLREMA